METLRQKGRIWEIDALRGDIHSILNDFSGEAAAYLTDLTDRIAVRRS